MKNSSINLDSFTGGFKSFGSSLRRYKGFILFLTIAALYGFIVWRINEYSNIEASQAEATSQANVRPRIDSATAEKLLSLQDNNVNVQSLFDQARDNPFQE